MNHYESCYAPEVMKAKTSREDCLWCQRVETRVDDKPMYAIQFHNKKFYAKSIDEAFKIIGEQNGDYSIELLKDDS